MARYRIEYNTDDRPRSVTAIDPEDGRAVPQEVLNAVIQQRGPFSSAPPPTAVTSVKASEILIWPDNLWTH